MNRDTIYQNFHEPDKMIILSGSFFMQLVRLKQINPKRQNVRILFRISSVLIIPVYPVTLLPFSSPILFDC